MLSRIEYYKSATMKPVKHSFDLIMINSAAAEPVHLLFSLHLWSVKNSLFTSVGSLEMLGESTKMVYSVFSSKNHIVSYATGERMKNYNAVR